MLLKSLCASISYPIQIVFNQLIYHGVFPDKIELVKIISLYKGEEHEMTKFTPNNNAKDPRKNHIFMHVLIP